MVRSLKDLTDLLPFMTVRISISEPFRLEFSSQHEKFYQDKDNMQKSSLKIRVSVARPLVISAAYGILA